MTNILKPKNPNPNIILTYNNMSLKKKLISINALFKNYDLTKDDERLYGCLLKPDNPNLPEIPDFVQLVVVGMYLFIEL